MTNSGLSNSRMFCTTLFALAFGVQTQHVALIYKSRRLLCGMYQYVSQYDSSHSKDTVLHIIACGVMDTGGRKHYGK